MKVKLKKLHDDAKLPVKATSKDFCYDVVAVWEREIAPNVWQYGLGFAYEIERDPIIVGTGEKNRPTDAPLPFDDPIPLAKHRNDIFMDNDLFIDNTMAISPLSSDIVLDSRFYSNINISIDFRPRSSVWKTGMILSNCEGTLDELYRGEVRAVYYHVLPDMPRYKVGDRIGQIKLGFTLPIEFEFVDEIDMNTDRGTGGFGSTGK